MTTSEYGLLEGYSDDNNDGFEIFSDGVSGEGYGWIGKGVFNAFNLRSWFGAGAARLLLLGI